MTESQTEALRERVAAALRHQYRIEDEIGRGGMAIVYRARDVRLERLVAIKVLPPELALDPALGARFTREAQTAAQLAHPHIVPIHDVGERDDIAYFVMSLIDGGNLAQRLAQQRRRPVDEVRRLLCETADALAYAHLRGVVHRDVKPDNILIDGQGGRAMVTDFGIARAIEGDSRLTLTGVAVGTPTYMSPEQAVGERDLDGRSDIYSLGVIGYQMLTGRPPFSAGNSMALLLKHVSERPRPIAELRPEAPKPLCDAIERALKKAPEDRWPTAAAMREALMTGDEAAQPGRREGREPIRYTSPIPRNRRGTSPTPPSRVAPQGDAASPPSPISGTLVLEPPHLAGLTAEQRADLRLWVGRVNLLDRVKSYRRYALYTVGAWIGGTICFGFGVAELPPLVAGPIVPIIMTTTLVRRGASLRLAGLQLRRVLFSRRSRRAIAAAPLPTNRQLRKLAARPVLESTYGAAIRRAAEERATILQILKKLSKADRALLPDVVPTVNALVERVAHLATTLHRIDTEFDPELAGVLESRLADAEGRENSTDELRQVALLRRQRISMEHLGRQRVALTRQLENAGLALENLRIDLLKLRASGLEAGLSDVTSATQEARALSHDIGVALHAVAEVRELR
ncbi:MAG TPA: serine/threonine-protein kinase [Gemmatimonadaceae bacterium]|nr:serine/threonine-protein kinase [Gemmatimonadaceae bacterium]